jgi:hypothetical protein
LLLLLLAGLLLVRTQFQHAVLVDADANIVITFLALADLPGDLLGLLLGFLAVMTLALQGLFDPLLNFTLLETLFFQLLNFPLLEACLPQLLFDLLLLLLA